MSLIRQLAASEGQAGSRGQVKGGKVNDDDDNNNNINIIIKKYSPGQQQLQQHNTVGIHHPPAHIQNPLDAQLT
jgi:hypothetical protein